MWLLNISTFQLEAFESTFPAYAILSHTWTGEELTFQMLRDLNASHDSLPGLVKVRNFCRIAEGLGLQYVWIDTCCIDKQSSAELTEAINSMYKWYRSAAVCVIYMVDVTLEAGATETSIRMQIESFRSSRWFSRGWTLQELIACTNREFYSSDWSRIDSEQWRQSMTDLLSEITGIPANVLRDSGELGGICIAERMSWVAHRETTRSEDLAYCLMGMFNVNMAVLYGEGLRGAFRRLQDEIMKTSFDQTLFAWRGSYESSGLLARTPRDFAGTPRMGLWLPKWVAPMVTTNIGILFRPCIIEKNSAEKASRIFRAIQKGPDERTPGVVKVALQCDVMTERGWMGLVLDLQPVEIVGCFAYGKPRSAYRRVRCSSWEVIPGSVLSGSKFADILVLEDESYNLVLTSVRHDRERWVAKFDATAVVDEQK